MAGILDNIHPALRSLWDLENELRSAAQNAIFLRNDEERVLASSGLQGSLHVLGWPTAAAMALSVVVMNVT
jgi:hypothetical protein